MPHPRPSCYAPPPSSHRKLDKGRPRTAFTCTDPARDCVHVGGKHECGKECTFTIRLGSARLSGPRQSCLAMPRARSHARIKSRDLLKSAGLLSTAIRSPRAGRETASTCPVQPRDGLHVVENLTGAISVLSRIGTDRFIFSVIGFIDRWRGSRKGERYCSRDIRAEREQHIASPSHTTSRSATVAPPLR